MKSETGIALLHAARFAPVAFDRAQFARVTRASATNIVAETGTRALSRMRDST